jgi:RHS repeat-associated protein
MRDGTFGYTLAGRMSSASTDQVSKAWSYDTAGRPATHSATMASPAPTTTAQTFTYGWDVAGNLTSLVYPGNLTATYVYDANNRMTGVSTAGAAVGTATLAYDTLSRRTSITYSGGSSQTYAFETDNDISSISHVFPNETAMNVSFSWTYDGMGRQVSETISNSAYQYEPPAATTAYGAANGLNQYPTVAGTAYTYRGDGVLSRDNLRNYYYDEKRNLTKVALIATPASTDVDWFDALGVRVFSYRDDPAAADPHRMELTDGIRPEVVWEEMYSTPVGSSTPTVLGKRYYVLGPNPDERLIYVDASLGITPVARYPHAGKRGETVAISRAGYQDYGFKYGPFGETTDSTAGYPWRYTGQRVNSWTGLYHYKARAYSTVLGRFLQPDPIGYGDGTNLHVYVLNDPINHKDPTGRTVECSGNSCLIQSNSLAN